MSETMNGNYLTGSCQLINCKPQNDKENKLVGVAMQGLFKFGDDTVALDMRCENGREKKILDAWKSEGKYEVLFTMRKGTGTLGDGRGTYGLLAVKVWDIKKVA